MDNDQKFFKDVYGNPKRTEELDDLMESVLYTIANQPNLVTDRRNKRLSQAIESNYDNKYSVIQRATISVTEVAKRPKYQLIAGILYQLKFYLRRIGSQKELFSDEKEYTDVLDAIVQGIEQNYPEYNHVLDIVKLKRGNESQFDKVLRQKIEQ